MNNKNISMKLVKIGLLFLVLFIPIFPILNNKDTKNSLKGSFETVRSSVVVSEPINIDLSSVIPIFIDDLDPSNNWESFISKNPWCIGTGEPGSSYIIYGILIDAQGGSNCITIKNSNKLYTIDSSVFFNTSQGDFSAGIYLENVSHGNIIYSNLHDHGSFGIKIVNCSNGPTIYRNSVHNNGDGIGLCDSRESLILENNIFFSDYSGIYLSGANNTDIDDNIISCNLDGLTLIRSNHITIQHNIISFSKENGIILQNYSSYNSITYNIISHALYCISIGSSTYRTYLNSNDIELGSIRSFGEAPTPPPIPDKNKFNQNSMLILIIKK